nr:hypothetical protein [Lachnospiraceae bacterium]
MKKGSEKGAVTIYMSIVLSVILSLFLAVIEGAKCRAVSLYAECAFDLAVYSVFAEYNRELFEQYDLFFIDTAYGEQTGSLSRTENHLKYYLNENLDSSSEFPVFNFTKAYTEQVHIDGASYATDDGGEVFERQAVAYMKHKYGISYGEKIKKELETAKEKELFTKDVSPEREANHAKIDEVEKNGIATGEVDENGNAIVKEVDVDNPADQMNGVRSKGILLLVINDAETISEQTADLTDCISGKKPETKGLGRSERDGVSTWEEFLFDGYILEKCGTFTNPKKTGQLQYQAEYVLAGKNNDIDNLKSVVTRLLMMREISNVTYLFADQAKVSEAGALAAILCEAAGAPVLIEPVKITLLFAWAYAESVYDVKLLLAGKKVPLIKTAADWHYSLEGMLQVESENVPANTQETPIGNGLSYEEYLRLFLAMEKEEQKVLRMMDIAQMDVRKNSGFQQFSLSNCVDLLRMEATVGSRYGYYREMKRTYYYI